MVYSRSSTCPIPLLLEEYRVAEVFPVPGAGLYEKPIGLAPEVSVNRARLVVLIQVVAFGFMSSFIVFDSWNFIGGRAIGGTRVLESRNKL